MLIAACASDQGSVVYSSAEDVAALFGDQALACTQPYTANSVDEETASSFDLTGSLDCRQSSSSSEFTPDQSVVATIYVFENGDARLRFMFGAVLYGCSTAPDAMETYFYGGNWIATVDRTRDFESGFLDDLSVETTFPWNAVSCNTANVDALPKELDVQDPGDIPNQVSTQVLAEFLGEEPTGP